VTEESAAVGEALEFLATGDLALVGSVVLVHVLAMEDEVSCGQREVRI
jgi:hypothetical protein